MSRVGTELLSSDFGSQPDDLASEGDQTLDESGALSDGLSPMSSSLSPHMISDMVTSNLMKLGTIALHDFLTPPYQDPPPPEVNLTLSYVARPATISGEEKKLPAHQSTPLFLLHQVCSQTFGSIGPLKYEFIDNPDDGSRQCILTITRPNGSSRSYNYKAEFDRKADARGAVAAIAVEMGAIDFIKNGAPDHLLKRGLVLAPLDAPEETGPDVQDVERPPSEAVMQIDKCCVEWRAGRVKPHWVAIREFKPQPKFGCILRIALSSHSTRVYSVDSVWDQYEDARSACAEDAAAQGVLEFIMHGNGQKHPAPPDYTQPGAVTDAPAAAVSALSVQGYFDSLPRPFPETEFGGKSVNDISAPSWLNQLAQGARGARISVKYIFIPDTKYGLHGALLRVERPSECKSFFVDPLFPKRADAKVAVCLLAMSQGVGGWIRKITREYEEKISFQAKERISLRIQPLIMSEYSAIWPGRHPDMFVYSKEKDAHACTMVLRLSLDPKPEEKRSWKVPAEYRSRSDARLAVLEMAFQNGAVEFLRFRGKIVPEGYVVQLPELSYKRKNLTGSASAVGHDFKRQRTYGGFASHHNNKNTFPRGGFQTRPYGDPRSSAPPSSRLPHVHPVPSTSGSNVLACFPQQDSAPASAYAGFHHSLQPNFYPVQSSASYHPAFDPPTRLLPSGPPVGPHSDGQRMAYPEPEYSSYAYPSSARHPAPPSINYQYRSSEPPAPPYHASPPPRYDSPHERYDTPTVYWNRNDYVDVPRVPRANCKEEPTFYPPAGPTYPTPDDHYSSTLNYPHQPPVPPPGHPQPSYPSQSSPHATHSYLPSSRQQSYSTLHEDHSIPVVKEEPRIWQPGPGGIPKEPRAMAAAKVAGSSKFTTGSGFSQRPIEGSLSQHSSSLKASSSPTGRHLDTSAREALIAHCEAAGTPLPQVFHEQVHDGFRVWVVIGKERMELQTTWKTVAEGEEKLCNQILKRKMSTSV